MRLGPLEHVLAGFGEEARAKTLIQPGVKAHDLLVAVEVEAGGEVSHTLAALRVRLGEEHDLALGEFAPVPGALPVDETQMDTLGRELPPDKHGS